MTDKLTREQIDLLPCPFCGGEAELDSQRGYAQYPSGKPGSGVAIYCATCSADMHLCREDMPDISTEEMVGVLTNEWNRRAHPAAEQEGEMAGMVKTLAQSVCRDVAELPDRSSPDDWPDAMLVTHDELALIVEHYARAALSAPDVPVSGLLPCPFCGGEAHFDEIIEQDGADNFGGEFVECTTPTCRITTRLMFTGHADVKPLLMEVWNRRALKEPK